MDSVTIENKNADRRSLGDSSGWVANHPDARTSRLSRLAVVGNYPPTQCGIASFTASLHRSLSAATVDWPPHVARVQEGEPDGDPRPEVVEELNPDNPRSIEIAARTLSAYGTVILQHEFGIYGSGHGTSLTRSRRP